MKGESGSWVNKIESHKYTRVSSNLTLIGEDVYTRLFRKKYYGAKTYSIINEIENGPLGLFNVTKSKRSIDGHITKLTGLAGLRSKWTKHVNIEASKCTTDKDGDYLAICDYDPDCAKPDAIDNVRDLVDLIGVSYTQIDNSTEGSFMFEIDNEIQGPVGIFYLTKNKSDSYASISRVSHSPSDDFNKLDLQWLPNSGIELCKTKVTFDGEYRIIPLYKQYLSEHIITLTGNDFVSETFLDEYERVVTMVSVESLDTDGASAIFAISKSHITDKPHITRIVAAQSGDGWDNCEIIGIDPPSVSSGDPMCLIVDPFEIVGVNKKCGLAIDPRPENIELVWDECDILKIRKNDPGIGSNVYDGQYRVRIYEYFTC